MDDKIDNKVERHGERIAAQEAALNAMEKSVASLADSVKSASITAEKNHKELREIITKNQAVSRPDTFKTLSLVGGVATVMIALSSLIMSLTVTPVKSDVAKNREFSLNLGKHVESVAMDLALTSSRADERSVKNATVCTQTTDHLKTWNTYLSGYIQQNKVKTFDNGERVSAIEATIKHMQNQLDAVDGRGSRKWIGGNQE